MKPRRNDNGNGRFYEIETEHGIEHFPSVTTILSVIGKPALINWAAKVEREMVLDVSADLYQDTRKTPEMSRAAWLTTMQMRLGKAKASQKELAKAGEIGAQLHALIEWTLRAELCQQPGPAPHITDAAQWAFMAWEDWRRSVNLKPLIIEAPIWSLTHRYAGTLDLLAEIEDQVTVVDWKTGKAVYQESYLQNAAYRHAIKEMGHAEPSRGMVLRLPKVLSDPNFEAVEVGDEAEYFDVFLATQCLWTWIQKEQAKKEAPVSQAAD